MKAYETIFTAISMNTSNTMRVKLFYEFVKN